MRKDELTMISFEVRGGRGEREKCGEKEKSGVFASRVVPNGVDATTAEWEGGAICFIYAGQGIRFCAPRKKKVFTTTVWQRCLNHAVLHLEEKYCLNSF